MLRAWHKLCWNWLIAIHLLFWRVYVAYNPTGLLCDLIRETMDWPSFIVVVVVLLLLLLLLLLSLLVIFVVVSLVGITTFGLSTRSWFERRAWLLWPPLRCLRVDLETVHSKFVPAFENTTHVSNGASIFFHHLQCYIETSCSRRAYLVALEGRTNGRQSCCCCCCQLTATFCRSIHTWATKQYTLDGSTYVFLHVIWASLQLLVTIRGVYYSRLAIVFLLCAELFISR